MPPALDPLYKPNPNRMSMQRRQASQWSYTAMLDPTPNPRKRKAMSDGDIDRINLAPRLRNHQNSPIPGGDYGPRQHQFRSISEAARPSPRLSSEAPRQTYSNSIPSISWASLTSVSSSDDSMVVGDGPPQGPGSLPNAKSVLSSCLSIGAWLDGGESLNSVRWPDPLEFSDRVPSTILEIPAFLFKPRPPPVLPQHILDFSFQRVLRRYNRLTKLIDTYHAGMVEKYSRFGRQMR